MKNAVNMKNTMSIDLEICLFKTTNLFLHDTWSFLGHKIDLQEIT